MEIYVEYFEGALEVGMIAVVYHKGNTPTPSRGLLKRPHLTPHPLPSPKSQVTENNNQWILLVQIQESDPRE
jgi:hypothetical protein